MACAIKTFTVALPRAHSLSNHSNIAPKQRTTSIYKINLISLVVICASTHTHFSNKMHRTILVTLRHPFVYSYILCNISQFRMVFRMRCKYFCCCCCFRSFLSFLFHIFVRGVQISYKYCFYQAYYSMLLSRHVRYFWCCVHLKHSKNM